MATIAPVTTSPSIIKPNETDKSVTIAELPIITNVWVDEKRVHFDLEDGRSVAWPFSGSSLLAKATPEQRQHFSYSAYHVFWDDIDEIVGIKNVLYPFLQVAGS